MNDTILVTASGSSYQGPWPVVRNGSFESEFSGVGVGAEASWCITSICRANQYVWGVSLGLSFFDLTGKSLGPNQHDSGDPNLLGNAYLEQKYQLNVSGFTASTSFDLVKFQAPRPTGNTTDLLTTRIEGGAIKIGVSMPFLMSYRAFILQREEGQPVTQSPTEQKEKGQMRGFSWFITLKTWIGA
jgi:hypothetical protein